MRIGLVGGGFDDARRMVRDELPDAELVEIAEDGSDAVGVDVLVPLGARVGGDLLDATGARLVQQFGVGVQGVDHDAAAARGVPVANVPGAHGNAVAVAEMAVLHLLALLRGYEPGRAAVARREVGRPIGRTLAGSSVAVLGVGAIGCALIQRLRAFDVTVTGIGRRERSAYPDTDGLLDRFGRATPHSALVAAVSAADALVVCTPLTEDTRGLVDADVLAALNVDAVLVNVGRGPVVDRAALLDALRSGRLAGAGLDVAWSEPIDPDDELFDHHVTVTPHLGGVTEQSYRSIAAVFADNVRRVADGDRPRHVTS